MQPLLMCDTDISTVQRAVWDELPFRNVSGIMGSFLQLFRFHTACWTAFQLKAFKMEITDRRSFNRLVITKSRVFSHFVHIACGRTEGEPLQTGLSRSCRENGDPQVVLALCLMYKVHWEQLPIPQILLAHWKMEIAVLAFLLKASKKWCTSVTVCSCGTLPSLLVPSRLWS